MYHFYLVVGAELNNAGTKLGREWEHMVHSTTLCALFPKGSVCTVYQQVYNITHNVQNVTRLAQIHLKT